MNIDADGVPGIVTKLRAVTGALNDRACRAINLMAGNARANRMDCGELRLQNGLVDGIKRMILWTLV